MKKFLSILLAVVLLLGCGCAMAAESDFKHMPDYFAAGTYSGSGTEIVVPASIGGEPTPILYADSLSKNALKGVQSLVLSEGVTQMRDSNTYGPDGLTTVSLPDTLEAIGRRNFYQADELAEIEIPASVAYIGQECFSYCDILTKVTFKGLCPAFGANCFKSAAADLVIYVPDDQLDAYKAALGGELNIQPSGKKAVVSRAAVSESDFVFDAATGAITGYTGKVGCFEVPSSIGGVPVKAIGKKAFFKNPFVVMVTLPEGIETVGESAFSAPPGLARVVFPSSLRTIEKSAFNGAKLDQLILPEGLVSIGQGAFNTAFGINKIDEIVIPGTVTEIGDKAFNANKAVRIVIGENVQSIGSEAFAFSSNLTEIVILNKNKIAFAGDAFAKCTTEATLTLAEGTGQDVYTSYVELMPMLFATCTVIEPVGMELPFPALDVMAGMPFFGTWHSVAVFDGTDYYEAELLGMLMDVVLNPDGTGSVMMDGFAGPGCWYMEEGTALFAPILEEGGKPALEEALPITLDENERMSLDFGGLFVLLEKEGAAYSVPAIPEKPWPELDQDNAKYFVGTWEAVSYTMDGETHEAALIGPMTLVLNADGTAQTIQEGSEPYDLRWYADYGMAYVGPTVNTAAKVTFDGSGNIQMEMEDTLVLLAPYTEEPEAPVIEGADELLGEWLDDLGNKLTVANDGSLSVTYASDGYVRELKWNVVDGAAVVTEGIWAGCPITLENGIVTISDGEGVYQLYSRDGDLSAAYPEPEMPEAVPVGAEGEPYFGVWTLEKMGPMNAAEIGMTMELTLNPDGTAAIDNGYGAEPGVWGMENGVAVVMGGALSIDAEGKLVMDQEGMQMIFAPVQTEAPADSGSALDDLSDEEMLALLALLAEMEAAESGAAAPAGGDPNVGVKFVMTGSMVQGIKLSAEQLGCAGDYVIFNPDGSADLVMSGIPVQTLGWKKGMVNVLGTEYEGYAIDYYGTYYNFAITEEGLLLDYFGMLRTYERE